MGSLAEPECRRIIAAIDLAEELRVPLEWFAFSAGALIAMESGTENMDWIARVLRRIVEFTQAGGELNVVVTGINVGAQPYWNAEATMLMHTKGILVMTPESAMVLTGKHALDYSGGVSAEDNQGIGGYERIMGRNGQAQFLARDVTDACRILLRHYDHAYVAPGERFPRPARTSDPRERDVCTAPHGGDFATVGEVFSEATNPGRKKPFEIRRVMAPSSTRTTLRWSAGSAWPRQRWRWCGTRTSAAIQYVSSDSSRSRCPDVASCQRTARTRGRPGPSFRCRRRRSPGRSTRPAAVGRSSCSPTCRGSMAHPSPCVDCNSSMGPRSAGPS